MKLKQEIKPQAYKIQFDAPKIYSTPIYNREKGTAVLPMPRADPLEQIISTYRPLVDKLKTGMTNLGNNLGLRDIIKKTYDTGYKIRDILYTPVGEIYGSILPYLEARNTKPKKIRKGGREKQVNEGSNNNSQDGEKLDYSQLGKKDRRKLSKNQQRKKLLRMQRNKGKAKLYEKQALQGKSKPKNQNSNPVSEEHPNKVVETPQVQESHRDDLWDRWDDF